MKSVLSLITIIFLITSSVPFGFADLQTTLIPQNSVDDSSAPKENRIISLSLHESVGLVSNPSPKNNFMDHNNVVYNSESSEKQVSFSENLGILTSTNEQQVQSVQFVMQPQAALERIVQPDKLREDRKKNLKSEILYLDDTHQQDSPDDSASPPLRRHRLRTGGRAGQQAPPRYDAVACYLRRPRPVRRSHRQRARRGFGSDGQDPVWR